MTCRQSEVEKLQERLDQLATSQQQHLEASRAIDREIADLSGTLEQLRKEEEEVNAVQIAVDELMSRLDDQIKRIPKSSSTNIVAPLLEGSLAVLQAAEKLLMAVRATIRE